MLHLIFSCPSFTENQSGVPRVGAVLRTELWSDVSGPVHAEHWDSQILMLSSQGLYRSDFLRSLEEKSNHGRVSPGSVVREHICTLAE